MPNAPVFVVLAGVEPDSHPGDDDIFQVLLAGTVGCIEGVKSLLGPEIKASCSVHIASKQSAQRCTSMSVP